VKDYLLCRKCEGQFSENGESEVLLWLSPKAKEFKLRDKIKTTNPVDNHPELPMYRVSDVGISGERFAYFALSVIWRGAVHQWVLRDDIVSTLLNLEPYEERVRQYLHGETGFPNDIAAVIMMVGSDQEGREVWGIPGQFQEMGVENFRLVTRGVCFRVALGPKIPDVLRHGSLANGVFFYGDLSRRIKQDFPLVFNHPLEQAE
jgi:hypothetical protein